MQCVRHILSDWNLPSFLSSSILFLLYILKQGLMYTKLTLNQLCILNVWFFCFHLPSGGITSIHCHAWSMQFWRSNPTIHRDGQAPTSWAAPGHSRSQAVTHQLSSTWAFMELGRHPPAEQQLQHFFRFSQRLIVPCVFMNILHS